MDFFILDLFKNSSVYAKCASQDESVLIDAPSCINCNAKLGPRIPAAPYQFEIVGNKKCGTLITDGLDMLVSEKFVRSFEQSGLVGLEFSKEPADLSSKVAMNERYFMAFPLHTRTLLDEMESGVVIGDLRGCSQCRVMAMKRIDRVVVNEESWSGEDVFLSGNLYSVILVTKKFVEFVNQNGFTNFHFIHQNDYNEDFDIAL